MYVQRLEYKFYVFIPTRITKDDLELLHILQDEPNVDSIAVLKVGIKKDLHDY